MKNLRQEMNEAADYIRKVIGDFKPDIGFILGSGLGDIAKEIENPIIIRYQDIPNMRISTVVGHAGCMVIGTLEGKKIMVFNGRIHYYEGYSMKDITFIVRIMQAMGIKIMLITNAAGGLKTGMKPGDLMLISDHINLMGDNPLLGPNDENIGVRFPNVSNAYDLELQKIGIEAFKAIGIEPLSGVYCGVTGPNYETYAEIRYLKTIGADAVGMSTVPEVIVAVHGGIKTIGVSCITDVISAPGAEVSHEEVLSIANQTKPRFIKLMKEIIRRLPV